VFWFLALSAMVTTLAWAIERQRREHRPIALFLNLAFLSDLLRWILHVQILLPAHELFGPAPLVGWYRVAGHVEQSLYLAWRAGFVALALVVFLERRPWPAFIVWAVTEFALVAAYPFTRGAVLQRCYFAAELTTLVSATGCYVMWWWRREPPTLQNLCVLLLGGCEIALAIGPYTRKNVFTSWNIAQAMLATMFVILLIVHGGVLWGLSGGSKQ